MHVCVCARAVMSPRKTILAACLAQVLIGSQPHSRGSVVPFVCLVVNPSQFVFKPNKITMKALKGRNKTCLMFQIFNHLCGPSPAYCPRSTTGRMKRQEESLSPGLHLGDREAHVAPLLLQLGHVGLYDALLVEERLLKELVPGGNIAGLVIFKCCSPPPLSLYSNLQPCSTIYYYLFFSSHFLMAI